MKWRSIASQSRATRDKKNVESPRGVGGIGVFGRLGATSDRDGHEMMHLQYQSTCLSALVLGSSCGIIFTAAGAGGTSAGPAFASQLHMPSSLNYRLVIIIPIDQA